MRSICFPKMFNTNGTNVTKENEFVKATSQNLILLLNSQRNSLYGDPYFGPAIRAYLFDQNSYALRDVLIDMIYVQIATFIPQVRVSRKDIDVIQDKTRGVLYCKISGISQIDYQPTSVYLKLFDMNE